ncbi:SIR2 family NAD-dependent protein deacylase [Dactylosporangium sp. CA-152071]|uniref:SIR2 family NAD-dependent protein deacylase n=1 Tax=Dactylosporangium sp. CA-152071 TaxID=3239933 RepID=UPI003D91412B
MRNLAAWIDAGSVVALTGAGISTDSGIPDFRGPDGVWTRDPEAMKLSSIDHYVADPQVRRRAWQERLHNPAWTAEPNAAHHALADLERAGKVTAVITQNIDGLHQRAGASNVIELHGTLSQTECLTCAERRPMPDTLARVTAGDPDPACLSCGGLLKSATISFGQSMHLPTLEAAAEAAMGCDVLLAIGTSLTVHPAAGLVDVAHKSGSMVVIINAAETPYDPIAHLLVRDPIGEVLPRLVAG